MKKGESLCQVNNQGPDQFSFAFSFEPEIIFFFFLRWFSNLIVPPILRPQHTNSKVL